MNALPYISKQLTTAGYKRTSDGTFISPDRRRIVVLMEAHSDPAQWPSQVTTALTAPGMQQMPAWGRYVVLVHSSVEAGDELRLRAAAFTRDVTKCRRIVVFPDASASPTLPFLPLHVTSTLGTTPEQADISGIIAKHLGRELASVFEDPDTTHAAVEREVERRATR